MDFRLFVESDDSDIKNTLGRIPSAHRGMLKPYKITFQGGNTLKGDGGHVGFIDEEKMTITIAAPWNYSREYTLLHEVGHMIWKYFVPKEMKEEWDKLQKGKKGFDKNAEENFCMVYAQQYVKNKITKFDHPELVAFIKKIPTKIQQVSRPK